MMNYCGKKLISVTEQLHLNSLNSFLTMSSRNGWNAWKSLTLFTIRIFLVFDRLMNWNLKFIKTHNIIYIRVFNRQSSEPFSQNRTFFSYLFAVSSSLVVDSYVSIESLTRRWNILASIQLKNLLQWSESYVLIDM